MTPIIGVCVKWIGSQPTSGHEADARFAQFSASDQAALEVALQRAEQLQARVRVVSVAPAAARSHLVALCASGAHELVHIAAEGQSSSAHIAHELAQHLRGCTSVWCGDYSLDRGSGSVPAFLASTLGAQQALGLLVFQPATTVHSTFFDDSMLDVEKSCVWWNHLLFLSKVQWQRCVEPALPQLCALAPRSWKPHSLLLVRSRSAISHPFVRAHVR
jgi:hypothetical protein